MFLFLRRFLARIFDYGLFYFFTVFMALVLPVEVESKIFVIYALWVPFCWMPFEAMLLRFWGTTPGKKLFGLSFSPVSGKGNGKMSGKEALKRAFLFRGVHSLRAQPIGIKRYLAALVLACLAGSALFLGENIAEVAIQYEQTITQSGTQSGWIQYVSDNGKFQVHFPKKPVEQQPQQFEIPNGDPLQVSEFKAHKEAEFSVSYLDLPKKWKLFSANTLLKGAIKVVQEHRPGAQLLDKKLVKHKNYPAMDFKMKEGEKEIEGRLILVDNTLYKLWVIYSPDTPREQQHEVFLDSFELSK